ncbi:hypothetical protein B0O99DRAFT_672048 [Bisporella sp. PMI_857]|nr:hypothetical protein B0O99DRAFT_672048 [Bisporella sp. PMI_857]
MKSLTGCTLLTVVKDFDHVEEEDQKIVQTRKPGFVPEVEPDLDDDMNEIPGTESMKLDAQVNGWVYKFIEDGFPLPDTPNLAPQKPGSANPRFQDSIKKHLDALKGASPFIMTPRREVLSGDGKITYQNYANHIVHIGRLKGYLKSMDSSLRINKEFLYKPLRDWDEEKLFASFTGRALFEYVLDRMKRKFGRLLMEDGGEDKIGLQEFDFGPSA